MTSTNAIVRCWVSNRIGLGEIKWGRSDEVCTVMSVWATCRDLCGRCGMPAIIGRTDTTGII
jgi:hypothetical protein